MSLSSEEYKKLMAPIEERVRHAYNKGYNDGIVDACRVVKPDKLGEIIEHAVYQAVTIDTTSKTIKTNLDWVRSLSAEELASWIYSECLAIGKKYTHSEKGIAEWLKEERFSNDKEVE